MKTRIAALAGALALTLLMSTVWGKGKPDKQLQQSAVLSAAFLLEIPDVPQYPPDSQRARVLSDWIYAIHGPVRGSDDGG